MPDTDALRERLRDRVRRWEATGGYARVTVPLAELQAVLAQPAPLALDAADSLERRLRQIDPALADWAVDAAPLASAAPGGVEAAMERLAQAVGSGPQAARYHGDAHDIRTVLAALAPAAAPEGATWNSPSLGRAYAEVERVRDGLAQPPESGIDESLRRALEAIETADCELTGMAS